MDEGTSMRVPAPLPATPKFMTTMSESCTCVQLTVIFWSPGVNLKFAGVASFGFVGAWGVAVSQSVGSLESLSPLLSTAAMRTR